MNTITLNTPVTVRVKGENKRLSNVVLVERENDPSTVLVLTGKRGRPRHLPIDRISNVKVLAS